MKRTKFILTSLAILPLTTFVKLTSKIMTRTNKGFKVNSGEARYGTHYKMKGVTLNVLDIKISSKDTDGELAVFEQMDSRQKEGLPYIFISIRMSFFI